MRRRTRRRARSARRPGARVARRDARRASPPRRGEGAAEVSSRYESDFVEAETVSSACADERAQRGLFLAFQYPHAVPGVTVTNFLRSAINAVRKARAGKDDPIPIPEFRKELLAQMEELKVTRELASRYINDGFSGGERKKMEMLQLAMMKPRMAVLDETDTGLDIDALKVVGNAVNTLVGPAMGALVITHFPRVLQYIKPNFVHVFYDGKIVAEGGPELADTLEADGYKAFIPDLAEAAA